MADTPTSQTASQGVALRQPSRGFNLLPSTLGEAMEIAKLIADSDFAPKDYKGKPANVLIAIQMGADVGLKPMQSLQNIAVINGRPSIWGDAAVALVQNADVLERIHETIAGEGDARTATCVIKRKGLPDEITRTFSVLDAKRANLWMKDKTPWVTYPDRMLQMRARSFALRDGASDVLMGLILAEEAMDYPDAINATVVSSEIVKDPMERVPEGMRENVEKAFATLNLNAAARTTKLNEFLGGEADPEEGAKALLVWCRDEYAKRKTGQPVARGDNSIKKPETASAAKQESPASAGGATEKGTGVSPLSSVPAGTVVPPAGGTVATGKPLTADEVFGKKGGPADDLGF